MYISTILLGSSVVDTLAEASNDYDVEGRENLNNVVASGRSRELSLYHKSPDGGNPSHTYSQYSPKVTWADRLKRLLLRQCTYSRKSIQR